MEHVWEGIYQSFDEVPKAGQGFEGDTWAERSTARVEALIESARQPETIPSVVAYSSSLLPFLAATVAAQKGRVRILDFGGALGDTFVPVIAALPDTCQVDYHVVDVPRIARMGAEMFAGDGRIHFHARLPASLTDVDIVHIGSALQYVAAWKDQLVALAAYRPAHFLFTDLPAGDIPTYASAQNYYETRIPCWFFNVGEVLDVMEGLGFRLAFKSTYLSTVLGKQQPYPQDNFPPEYRLGYPASLLFCRETRQP